MDTTNTTNNNDDTTTTEYDSGGSEGVDYAYEGQQVAVVRRGSIESSASQRKHEENGGATPAARKDKSPKRRTSPPRGGKSRNNPPAATATTTRCVCGAAARDSRDSGGESTASTNTDLSSQSDTEDEDGPGKRLSGPRKPRPSGPGGGRGGDSCDVSDDDDHVSDRPRCDRKCCREKTQKKTSRKNSTNTTASSSKKTAPPPKKAPYIEEYPEEIRPVVLLKEHKLPRGSFSSSNETSNSKPRIRSGTEDHQQMSSSLGKIQTMGKRPTWPSSFSAMREEQQQQQQQQRKKKQEKTSSYSSSFSSSDQQPQRESATDTARRRRQHHGNDNRHGHKTTRHEVPGERFSGSELEDFDSGSDSDDREMVRHRDHRPSMVRRGSRNHHEPHQHTERGAEIMPSAVSRSSAARNHPSSPKYSSSWPLQRGSHYDRDPRQPGAAAASRQHRIIHEEPEQMGSGGGGAGYESGDESDDIFTGEFEFDETTHRRKPKRPPSPPPAASIADTNRDGHHHHYHRYYAAEQQNPNYQRQQQQQQQQQVLHRQPSQLLRTIQDEEQPRSRRRRLKPPRPPVARTVVSHRPSMGALDQGIDGNRAGAYASSTCDIWRGRPEDWESPYSSSSDHEDDDYDDGGYYRGRRGGGGGGGDAPAYDYRYDHMMLLEGDRQRQRVPPSHISHASGRSSSPQLLPPRQSGDLKSVFSLGFGRPRDPSPVGTQFSRRSTRAWDAADEHGGGLLFPPAPSTHGGGGGDGRRAGIPRAPSRAATERSRWTVMVPEYNYDDYGYEYGGNDYGVAYSPPPAPAPTQEDDETEGCYSYGGFGPTIRVQAPSPPFLRGGIGASSPPPSRRHRKWPMAMSEEEMGYGHGRSAGGLLSPVPTRTVAARFNFDKSWSDLSRLLL